MSESYSFHKDSEISRYRWLTKHTQMKYHLADIGGRGYLCNALRVGGIMKHPMMWGFMWKCRQKKNLRWC